MWSDYKHHALTFCALTIGYATYSASRRSLPVAMPFLLSNSSAGPGLTNVELGMLSSSFSIAYGLSKFFGGVLSDFVSCRALFTGGLLLAGICNALFAMPSSNFALLCFCWGMNGAVQGVGWPSLSKILLATWSKENRGLVWSLATASGNAGTTFGPVVMALAVERTGSWTSAFNVAAIAAGTVGVFCGLVLKDTTATNEVAKPAIGNEGKPTSKASAGEEKGEKGTRTKTAFTTIVIFRWSFWVICVADAGVYLVLKGISDWAVLLLVQRAGMGVPAATAAAVWYEFGGMLGTLSAGPFSDRLGNRNAASSAFSIGLATAIAGLWLVTAEMTKSPNPVALYGLLAWAGACANGPKTLCGMAVRERQREAAGTAGGALGLVGQLGASLAGFPVGVLLSAVPAAGGAGRGGEFGQGASANKESWGHVLLFFCATAALVAVLFAMLAAEEAIDAAEVARREKED